MGHRRYGGGGRENKADGEQADGPDVRSEFTERREVGRGPQNRRQEDKKHEVGVEMHDGQFRHERQNEPSDHEQNGIGNEQPIAPCVVNASTTTNSRMTTSSRWRSSIAYTERKKLSGAPPYRISCPEGDHRFSFHGVISPCISLQSWRILRQYFMAEVM